MKMSVLCKMIYYVLLAFNVFQFLLFIICVVFAYELCGSVSGEKLKNIIKNDICVLVIKYDNKQRFFLLNFTEKMNFELQGF